MLFAPSKWHHCVQPCTYSPLLPSPSKVAFTDIIYIHMEREATQYRKGHKKSTKHLKNDQKHEASLMGNTYVLLKKVYLVNCLQPLEI